MVERAQRARSARVSCKALGRASLGNTVDRASFLEMESCCHLLMQLFLGKITLCQI